MKKPTGLRASFILTILLGLASSVSAEVESDCRQSWGQKHSKYQAKRSGGKDLTFGARGLEFQTVNLAPDEQRKFHFGVRTPGILRIRNAGKDLFDATLHLTPNAQRELERAVSLGTLKKGHTVSVPVGPGEYFVSIQEQGEFEESECPPLSYRVEATLIAAGKQVAKLLAQPFSDETKLKPLPTPTPIEVTLSALNPEPKFALELKKPSLVEVSLAKDSNRSVELLLNGAPQGKRLRTLSLWSSSFSLKRPDGVPIDRVHAANFTLRVVPFQGEEERIFDSLPEKAKVEVLGRVAAKLVFKNLSPVDFKKVTLRFAPTFQTAQTPPGMTLDVQSGRPTWTKSFDGWKAFEEKVIDFGVLVPSIRQVESYHLSVFVIALEAQGGPVQVTSEHLLKAEVALSKTAKVSSPQLGQAVEQANTVEHPDYESQLKIPVMANCWKKHAQNNEAFQKCQGLVLQWRDRCSATHQVTTSEFVECVRKGLQGEAPELLKR